MASTRTSVSIQNENLLYLRLRAGRGYGISRELNEILSENRLNGTLKEQLDASNKRMDAVLLALAKEKYARAGNRDVFYSDYESVLQGEPA
jgi:hypothetical protein